MGTMKAAVLILPILAATVSLCSGTCDPLVEDVCGYPFPNDFWRNSDTNRLNLTNDVFPTADGGKDVDVKVGGWNDLDGFSPIPQILTSFKHIDLDKSKFARFWSINDSLSASSPVALINAETGLKIEHWAELDHSADSDQPLGYDRSLILWPSERLNDSTRYIVAFRNLVQHTGLVIKASAAFEALRDNKTSTDPNVEGRRGHFEKNIFPLIKAAGFERSELTLAWDFTTMSQDCVAGRFVSMRDDAFKRVANKEIPFVFSKVQDNPRTNVGREIFGEMTVPWYLNTREPGDNVRLNIDPNDVNRALYNGQGAATFKIIVPQGVFNGSAKPEGILQYGHGLFGSEGEIDTSYLDEEADRNNWVIIATNWIGLSWEDEVFAGLMALEDLTKFGFIPDRSHQGMLNALLLMKLATSPSFMNHKHMVNNQSVSFINPNNRHYYGNSQGGILGGVYMAVSTDVSRGVLGVTGAPYALLLPRSKDFGAIFDILKVRYYTRAKERIMLLSAMQLLWNRMEPAGYIHYISRKPLANTPAHTVLVHYGLGDAQVSWLGAQTLARSVGAHMYESNVREGNETLTGYKFISDSTNLTAPYQHLVQGYDFGSPLVPFVNTPPDSKYDTHEKVRRDPRAQEANSEFLNNGIIFNPCHGPCKPLSKSNGP